MAFNVDTIRKDFPVLNQQVHGYPLVYLDNAATTQKPQCVIDALTHYYEYDNANIHRGVHTLSERATAKYEAARQKIGAYIHASSEKEIIFVRGATEAINLVAQTYGRKNISAGDEILVSMMEHHSNIVPWQMLCEQTGATLKVIPMNEHGELIQDKFVELLNKNTALLAIGHLSNALGTVNPVKEMIEKAHALGVPVLVDGAQATAHMTVDVVDLDVDFYVMSAHKMFGPTGVGALYAKAELLAEMPPWHGGGDMIRTVSFSGSTYSQAPYKFEAGTPNIAGAIAWGAAIDYLNDIGLNYIAAHEHDLLAYATNKARQVAGLKVIGQAKDKASILSFVMSDIHPHDLGTILDRCGVAVRAGHHCAMPVMQYFDIAATTRASFAFYNTTEEIDRLFAALAYAQEMFS
ncbi:MAG: SufS family cysteine desulfurase [Mariprofundaceae bacterium]|nr:SufS family cysteine desulfurase [Mariprofundaceae bacterium]